MAVQPPWFIIGRTAKRSRRRRRVSSTLGVRNVTYPYRSIAMQADFIVRVAERSDVETLTTLIVNFRDFLGRDGPTEGDIRASMVAQLRNTEVQAFIAFRGDIPIGYALVLFRYSHWANGLEATVNDLFVRENERGTGVGRQLIVQALTASTSRGCRLVTLSTNEMNVASNRIYESLGFSCYSTLARQAGLLSFAIAAD
ncbi:MAG: GNAT family N-acetyltransferase [Rubrivivax sp.]|nr:GNAT family N-acetyltransferase [Rubrivivax sp.]